MKIIQLLPELNQGGVERGTVELNRELVRRGHKSVVISAGGRLAEQITADGGQHVTLDVCSKNPLTAPLRILRLKRLLRQLKPDIVHARSRVPAWLCVFALKGLNIPFVTTVHGFNSVNAYSRVMTAGDRVICVSNSMAQYIQKNYHTPEDRIRIVHRGLDPEAFSLETLDQNFVDSFRQQYDLGGKYVIASVGRISPLKNFESFIQAIQLCSEQAPDIIGLIVGGAREDKKDHLAELKTRVADLGIEDKICFTGSQHQMAEIYHLSDLAVICSRKPESFGRSLIEAMAMGTPVIAPPQGGPLDIIKDGQTGIFCENTEPQSIAQAIIQARKTSFPGLREYVIENFSLECMVNKEFQVYRELV